MPYDLSDLAGESATCTSTLGITVSYRLENVTPRVLRQMDTLAASGEERSTGQRTPSASADALINILCTLATAWDLTDHGEPVPLTPDALSDIRVEILGDVVMAMVEDANGTADPQKRTRSQPPSRATSAQKAARS